MEILLDASSLNYPLSGIGYYCLNLYKSLLKVNSGKHNFHFLWHHKKIEDEEAKFLFQALEESRSNLIFQKEYFQNLSPFVPKLHRYLRYADRRLNSLRGFNTNDYDVYHGQDLLFDIPGKARDISTIHDLTTVKFPGFHAEVNIIRNEKKLNYLRENASAVVSVSKHTEKDLLEYYPEFVNRSHVIYNFCHEIFEKESSSFSTEIIDKLQLRNVPYLLSVCTIEPRKNLIQVLRVFELLKQETKYKDIKLVLAGDYGWGNSDFNREFSEHKYKKDIIITGYLRLEDLPILYKNALIFYYLSLYEGFGLPVLEAMKVGSVVIASNVSSIPEVTGKDGAVLVDPQSLEEVLEQSRNLLEKPSLREAYRQNGMKNSAFFQPEEIAKQYLALYEALN
ncbi:glycosyltransferase family 4 protein [Leptospira idonii]|uniref:Glycosyltransferase family 1 protein n=1 Tax=Leptospira idonii TaxID=1193500 RepID=A0A4V3JXR4_9LEPT|nr:glycosyltransferase family 1 protein [Leptospira idonii]TGN18306.1 glycosyltransferase family 1 protein [Leptospira idonii]